jgi:hypothetical protein
MLGPNITCDFAGALYKAYPYTDTVGALSRSTDPGAISYNNINNDNWRLAFMNFSASRSSSIYGKSTNVQPPSLAFNYIVKY